MGVNRNLVAALALVTSASIGTAVVKPVEAGPYTAEYVFGDSFSDNGNLSERVGKVRPNPPNYNNSFTNGPVAVQDLASYFGLSLSPSLWVSNYQDPDNFFGGAAFVPGTNYAVAAATAAARSVGGTSNSINLPQQVAAFSAHFGNIADPAALYVVMIGGNDILNSALNGVGPSAVTAGVNAEVSAVATLSSEGAKDILVVNVPDFGKIPLIAQDNPSLVTTVTSYSQLYNRQLAAGLDALALPSGSDLMQFDLYDFNNNLLANATAEGFTDTVDRCYTATPYSAATSPQCGTNAANIGSFIYWDSIHPTETVHALWAQGMIAEVPEPASLALFAVGLAGLAVLRRPRK